MFRNSSLISQARILRSLRVKTGRTGVLQLYLDETLLSRWGALPVGILMLHFQCWNIFCLSPAAVALALYCELSTNAEPYTQILSPIYLVFNVSKWFLKGYLNENIRQRYLLLESTGIKT